jgi:hypothetical protein
VAVERKARVTGLLVRRIAPFVLVAVTVAGVTVAAMAAGPVAQGSRAQVNDPDDTRGPLDVRRVWFDDPADAPPNWSIITFGEWHPKQLYDKGFVFVYLDTNGTDRSEYYVLIRSAGPALAGSLWRDPQRGGDIKLLPIDVTRNSMASLTLEIPVGRLDVGQFRTFYGWYVVTTFTGQVCRATCVDRVPDAGAFEQPIGTPTPTPTGTPIPTPTPSLT